jgi:O-antigen ligase
MKKNVGGVDKMARIAVGALLIVLALTGTIGAWGWIGVLPLATGLLNSCPAYSLLGISTCKAGK